MLTALLLFLTSPLLLRADADNSPVFILETVAGTTHKGPIHEITERGVIRIGGKDRLRRDPEEWVRLRRDGKPPPPFPSRPHLILSGGDRVPIGGGLRVAREQLHFASPLLGDGKEARVPLSAVSIVLLATPDLETDPAALRGRLLARKRTHDVVLLRNGDELEGALQGIDERGVRLEVARKSTTVELARVAVIALSSDLATSLRPKEAHFRATLADGTRLTLKTATSADGERLAAVTAFDAPLSIPLEQMRSLEHRQGRWDWLTDLKPRDYRHTAYLDVAWPLGVDRGVGGTDLCLAGGVHDRGLGMHSESRVTFALPPGYRRFEALAGLDERTGRKGSVRVRVLVDGKEADLGLKDDLTAASGGLPVKVDVSGAKELTLVVEFGRGGDVGDHVNWADARLLR